MRRAELEHVRLDVRWAEPKTEPVYAERRTEPGRRAGLRLLDAELTMRRTGRRSAK
jgi:hypothetical protein